MSAPDRNIDEWTAQARQARAQLEPDWRPERQERALRGVYQRRRREQVRRVAAGAALCAAALLVLLRGGAPRGPGAVAGGSPAAPPAELVAAAPAGALQLDGGAVVEALGAARLERAGRPGAPALRLRGGAARFRAAPEAPAAARTFRLEVAGASIEILGTVFLVEELADGARVQAEGEAARVTIQGQRFELAPGEARTFPLQRAATPSGEAAQPAEEPSPGPAVQAAEPATEPGAAAPPTQPRGELAQPAAVEPAARPARRRSWRTLAQDGQFERAYGALQDDGAASEIDEPGDLLLLADVARLSRHPREAVAPLERLLDRHRRDPRAPLAAFTLGRVLLDDLGRPREAAAAFRRAQQLDPEGPMAQDALAREVEAWSRAGDGTRARERAEAYLRLHPEGRRLRSVRRFGGLD